ncbi:MAG: hypothetical protein AAB392_00155 [Patescibacteria group bacterium]
MESDPNQNPTLSLEEQVDLVKKLLDAVDVREKFIERMGGFDDFADVHQHVGDNRKQYDELWATYEAARNEFDQKISDKKVLVEHLRKVDKRSADRIAMMFRVR